MSFLNVEKEAWRASSPGRSCCNCSSWRRSSKTSNGGNGSTAMSPLSLEPFEHRLKLLDSARFGSIFIDFRGISRSGPHPLAVRSRGNGT